MYKIDILTVGKIKHPWINGGIQEYAKRLQTLLSINWICAKEDHQLAQLLGKYSSYIILDEEGDRLSSKEFSSYLISQFQYHKNALCIVIGGAYGLERSIKEGASRALQISSFTLTSEMCRLLLTEQLYRALTIAKNLPYHK